MDAKCKSHCAHYMDKGRLYKHKFLICICIATFIMSALCAAVWLSFRSSNASIVELHEKNYSEIERLVEQAGKSPDLSGVCVNDEIVELVNQNMNDITAALYLQQSKIEADFTVLSLWAGVMMIVFLIFSIYSVFKTDELLKQGRDGVDRIYDYSSRIEDHVVRIDAKTDEAVRKFDDKVKTEVNALESAANTELAKLKTEFDDFKKLVNDKSDNFRSLYEEYVKSLDEKNSQNETLVAKLLLALRNNMSETQDSATGTE